MMTRHRDGSPERTRRLRTTLLAVTTCAATVTGGFAVSPTTIATASAAEATAPRPVDGRTEAGAAASCWEIKQRVPDAASGVYWLRTPRLVDPMRAHCDMETDGGGWVLVGRGRQGWRHEAAGLGTSDQVANVVTGTSAYPVRQLSADAIDGLLDGGRVDALTDGIRIRRATNRDGTQSQEVRLRLARRDTWSWTFAAKHQLSSMTVDGADVPLGAGNTADVGDDTAYRRLNTQMAAAQSYAAEFAYGSGVAGYADAASALWSKTDGQGAARPFAQVWLRPKLTTPDAPATPPGATTRRALPETIAMPTTWGVSGLASNGGAVNEMRTEVQAFAQVGDLVYVGGNFARVQNGADGSATSTFAQPYLAAFDVTTGAPVRTFTPTFDNQIKTLAALPNGRIAVGGEFGNVNGERRPGFVVLDASSGAVVPTLSPMLENRLTGGTLSVRSVKVRGDQLYVGGAFTHFTAGTPGARPVYARSAARMNLTTGAIDANWNPALNGTAVEISPSADGSRAYLAGYFTKSATSEAMKAAAVSTAAGAALIPWKPSFSVAYGSKDSFQFVIKESDNHVWVGGAQHSLFRYTTNNLGFLGGGLSFAGGDFQTAVVAGDTVFAGCHCADFFLTGMRWYNWNTSFTQADSLGFIGAWDAASGTYQRDFSPRLTARNGYGAWSSFVDSTGVLWTGGSFTKSFVTPTTTQWSGGYVRFAPRDVTAPQPPSRLKVDGTMTSVTASWTASPTGGDTTYELAENGRVIATTTQTSVTFPTPEISASYTLTARDAAGNRSAATDAVQLDRSVLTAEATVVADNSLWRWMYAGGPPQGAWTTPEPYSDDSWFAGRGPLGWGSTDITTNVDVPQITTRPLTLYGRTRFELPSLTGISKLTATITINDGAVAYLNGTEIARGNMPTGPIYPTTYATAGPRASTAAKNRLVVEVPVALLRQGRNILAIETHLNYKSTPDLGLAARLVATRSGQ